jgi:hypothetical protein
MNQPLQGERDDAEDMTALVAPPPAASTCLKKVWIVGKEAARECKEKAEKIFFRLDCQYFKKSINIK